jgi:hypothetical protein
MRRLALLGLLLGLAVLVLPAAPASATSGALAADLADPPGLDVTPPGFTTTQREVQATVRSLPQVRKLMRAHPEARQGTLILNGRTWDVSLMSGTQNWADVLLTSDGRVEHIYTGVAANSFLARGHFNDTFDQPWLWLAFGVLFVVPFVDPRRLRRLLHLDLAVLASFGVSYAFFDTVHSNAAVWAVYPPLLYLLVRMLATGLRVPRRGRGRLVPVLPTAVLVVGVIALFGARVALTVTSDKVMDIGYASVIGADRITHKLPLYEDNDGHGDTYGPVNYLAYVPFELLAPKQGDDHVYFAAKSATIVFDLLTIGGLVLLGLRLRAGPEGRRLGLALAWAWAAFPFTVLGVMENTNDGLVALLLVGVLLTFTVPTARGALLGLATAAKFSPGALLLVIARGRDGDGRRAWVQTVASCLGIFAFAMVVYLPDGGLREVWNCTVGFQLSRPPDFSAWAITDQYRWTQTLLEVAGLGVVAVVSFWPGRRTLIQVSALAAAALIAIQLPAGHWFYFYIMWFLPLALVAVFGAYRDAPAVAAAEPEAPETASYEVSPRLAA